MSNIRIDLEATIINGQTLTFKSPVDCSQITGLIVYYPEGDTVNSKTFQFADAHGNNVGSVSLFAEDVLVKVILDTDLDRAYVQNADTNAYLERMFAGKAPASHATDKNNPHGVTAGQVGARPADWMPTASDVKARPDDWMPNAEEVGAMSVRSVWKNASQGSEFPGQTVAIDLTDYDFVLVRMVTSIGASVYKNEFVPIKTANSRNAVVHLVNFTSTATLVAYYRTFSAHPDGVTFTDASGKNTTSTTAAGTNNSYLVPTEIFAIKGGLA